MAVLTACVFHKWAEPKGSTEQCNNSERATGKTKGKYLHYGDLHLNGVLFRKKKDCNPRDHCVEQM